ncbi:response regulator [Planotetraspora thailandica]|uniref:response regulator transcription factor n=1 Tax=Planotetraspora thailandica TaxID=487172 RepID=UPI0027E3E935|nr:response regulator transcription factor [Planotetraspora thailandica]
MLVADDQALVRAGFRSILEKQPDIDVVGEAGDGVEAVYMARTLRPDLVLMDIRMPRQDGLSATEELMASEAPPRIVVLTTFDADEYVYAALRVGATGFLLKDISPEDLVAAVRNAMSGDAMLSPRITRRLIESFVGSPPPAGGVPEALRGLTGRELDVLRELATGATNAEIGVRLCLAETTVKTHLAHVFAKLQVRDRVQAVVLAYESGLVRPSA